MRVTKLLTLVIASLWWTNISFAQDQIMPKVLFGMVDTVVSDQFQTVHFSQKDQNGNQYVVGTFNYLFFPPGDSVPLRSNGESDIFVLKLNSLGNVEWAKNFGSRNPESIDAVALSSDGHLYIVSELKGHIAFNDFNSTAQIPIQFQSVKYDDEYIVKIDPMGELDSLYNNGEFDIKDIKIDGNDNIYIRGEFQNSNTDFDFFKSSEQDLDSYYNDDVGFAKYDPQGNFQWAHHLGGSHEMHVDQWNVNDNGALIFGGSVRGRFKASNGTDVYLTSGSSCGFYGVVDSSGTISYINTIVPSVNNPHIKNNVTGLAIDEENNGYIAAQLDYKVDLDPSANAADTLYFTGVGEHGNCILKVDSAGQLKWAKETTYINDGIGVMEYENGQLYYVDAFNTSFDLDINDAIANPISFSISGGLLGIVSFDTAGNYQSHVDVAGFDGNSEPNGLWVDDQNVRITGDFKKNAELGALSTLSQNIDLDDGMVLNYDFALTPDSLEQYGGKTYDSSSVVEQVIQLVDYAIDKDKNHYILVDFYSDNDIDPSGNTQIISTSNGNRALIAYDSLDNLLWYNQYFKSGSNHISRIQASDDYLFVFGETPRQSTMDIDPQTAGIQIVDSVQTYANKYAYFGKIDQQDGKLIDHIAMGTGANIDIECVDIQLDQTGQLGFTVTTTGSQLHYNDLSGNISTLTLPSSQSTATFIFDLNLDLDYWVLFNNLMGEHISFDQNGDLLQTGITNAGALSLSVNGNSSSISTPANAIGAFVKINSNASFNWAKFIETDGSTPSNVEDLTVKSDLNNRYIYGFNFKGNIDVDFGSGTTFIANSRIYEIGGFIKTDEDGVFDYGHLISDYSGTLFRTLNVNSDNEYLISLGSSNFKPHGWTQGNLQGGGRLYTYHVLKVDSTYSVLAHGFFDNNLSDLKNGVSRFVDNKLYFALNFGIRVDFGSRYISKSLDHKYEQEVAVVGFDQINFFQDTIDAYACDEYFSPSGKYYSRLTKDFTEVYTAANGADSVLRVQLQVSDLYIAPFSQINDVSCFGTSDGSARVYAYSGIQPYTYTWSHGGDSLLETSLAAGDYVVAVSDTSGCIDSTTITVSGPDSLEIHTQIDTTIHCHNATQGKINVSGGGGAGGYSFVWNGTTAAHFFNYSTAGTYAVTIKDQTLCERTDSITIVNPDSVVAQVAIDTNVTCIGGNNGVLSVDVTGGSGTYSYTWNTGQTVSQINGLTEQQYIVTVSDVNGCSDLDTATLIAYDSVSPTALPYQYTAYVGAGGNVSVDPMLVDSASTDNCAITSIELSQTNFTCADIGQSFNVWFKVTDVGGNQDSVLTTISVADSMAPVSIAQNITLYLNGSSGLLIDSNALNSNSTDNCGIASIALSNQLFSCADVGVNNVQQTVYDVSGNSHSTTALVTIVDTISPTAVTQSDTVYLNANGSAVLAVTDLDNGSFDNCSSVNLSLSVTNVDCSNLGLNSVQFTVTDSSGNSSSTSVNVWVLDTFAPQISINGGVDLYLNAAGFGALTVNDVSANITDNCVSTSTSISSNSFDCSHLGANNTITIYAEDGSGNKDSVDVAVTVWDTITPVSIAQNSTVYLDANGLATIDSTFLDNGSYDNCAIVNMQLSQNQFTGADLGANTVIQTVTDASGNTNNTTAVVTVEDTIAPIVAAQNLSVNVDVNGDFTLTTGQVNNGSSDNVSIASLALSETVFDCSHIGSNTLYLIATDQSGNSDSVSFTLTINDVDAPQLTAVSNPTLYLNANGTASVSTSDVVAQVVDNCQLDSTWLSNYTLSCNGLQSITAYAVDLYGNIDSIVVLTQVLDTIAPVVSTTNITVYLDQNGQAIVTAVGMDNGSNDNCGIAQMSLSDSVFTCSDIGVNTVNFSAVDAAGNISSQQVSITVLDSVAPNVIVAPVQLYLDATGIAQLTYAMVDAGTTDNCGIDSIQLSQETFDCSNVGTNTVTVRVVDVNGNPSQLPVVVTVSDTIAPVFAAHDTTVYLDVTGWAGITLADVSTGATDNCGIDSEYLSNDQFACSELGSNSITVYAEDVNGNIRQQIINVTVLDTLAPEIVCMADTVICEGIFDFVNPNFTDNCNAQIVNTGGVLSGDYLTAGNHEIIFEAEDASGNIDVCTTQVEVNPIPNTYLGNDTVVGEGTILTFMASDSGNYVWSNGSNNQTIDVLITQDSIISLEIENDFGCTSSDTIQIDVILDSKSLYSGLIQVYPNPVKESLKINLNEMTERVMIRLVDSKGALVYSSVYENRESEIVQIPVDYLSAGIYHLSLVNEKINESYKINVQ